MNQVCPEHIELVRVLERLNAQTKGIRVDLAETKKELRQDIADVRSDIKDGLTANGARRESIGILKGQMLLMASLVSAAVSAVMAFLLYLLRGKPSG